MCGRFVLISNMKDIVEYYDIDRVSSRAVASYNIAPGREVAVVIRDDDGSRHVVDMTWGFVPSIGHRFPENRSLINARSETVNRKPSFREAFKKRRCLVIADGYYEWQQREGKRAPWYLRFVSGKPLGLAALYNHQDGPNDGVHAGCAIITTMANDLTRPIHARMPAILSRNDVGPWLDPARNEANLLDLLRSRPSDEMEAWEVSVLVNSPRHDVPACIEPVSRR